ncbi:TonB-dependent receptor [Pseudomonas sp. REP124]|uniref:TonB-dependent receptor family protein n=1 Tax=Pseudomonas sp. REP124 TaxID=2875731 RepID=UPI001CC9BACE|nr:TonB-dependent receptor [Pseudomonas sp. REP124]MBZ9783768.1 TonB-dependent receptor [Pseudomonas sp. REP124]
MMRHIPLVSLALGLICNIEAAHAVGAEDGAQTIILPDTSVVASVSSLTVPDTAQATTEIQRTPGAVEVVSDKAFKNGPAQTIKDMLGWVPGVFAQSRYGDDARVSIRGSGLSRNYGNRGVNMYMDGIPINTSDGLVDLFEVDPTAYRYVEVYKGANALRYGGNSLGGAINFVTPTGRDASAFDGRIDGGSFGYLKSQASTGGADGPFDYFVTGSAQEFDGYRDHSDGHQKRLSSNFGYKFSPDVETRFYFNANEIRQRLPGEVTKEAALHSPRKADSEFERLDQQRNIDSVRVANKTTLRLDDFTTLDFGVFGVHRHVKHPIYQWLDYDVDDYGGFVRATDDREIGGFRNRLVAGVNLHNGKIDNNQYENLTGGHKGALAASNVDESKNVSAYGENSFYFLPNVALVAGMQFQHEERDRRDRFLSDGDQSGNRTYDNFSPKVGVLWDVDPAWQVFANISRSAEAPTFDANSFASPASTDIDAQTATTYEVGTRGDRQDFNWDVALYRSEIKNELQCLTTAPWSPCTVVNADRTVHQGLEAGLGIAVLRSAFSQGDSFWFNAAYTYSDFFFDGDSRYGNNDLPGVPPQYVRAELLYKHPSGVSAGPNTEWVPQNYYADNANQVKADNYALLNFKIGYDPQRAGWSGYVEGRNLLDKRYIANVAIAGSADADSALYNPGTGRAVYTGIRFVW